MNWARVLMRSLQLAHVLLALVVAPLAGFLLRDGETVAGRLVGGGALFLVLASFCVWVACLRRLRWQAIVTLALVITCAGACLLMAYQVSPRGDPSGGRLTQHFSGSASFRRGGLANMVPEIDQLKLGTRVFPILDPFIDAEQGRRIRALFLEIYRELRADPAFCDVGSALGFCYEDIFFGRTRQLHFYEYRPKSPGAAPAPVLVFLHGSLGNFKGYTWLLRQLAEEHGIAILCPTYGAGQWHRERGLEVVEAIEGYVDGQAALDGGRTFLAGLSNGGIGVTRVMLTAQPRYAGYVLISPVMDRSLVDPGDSVTPGDGRKVLVLHGESDRRIPASYVRRGIGRLRSSGYDVAEEFYPEEDHFLLFSERQAVIQSIADWIAPML